MALKNNLLWVLFFTLGTVCLGLTLAAALMHSRFTLLVKSMLFAPMAISYVAAGVIWSFTFSPDPQVGSLNALLAFLKIRFFDSGEGMGMAFLGNPHTVNGALIFAGVWMWCGFCTIVLFSALQAIPREIVEAGRVDGLNAWQSMWRLEIPMIRPTLAVVTLAMIINVLKVFDLVYVMTGGGPFGASEVVANRMYRVAFSEGNLEYASAMAVVLFLMVLPVLIFNVRQLGRKIS